jgi:uncharacterized membrane protein
MTIKRIARHLFTTHGQVRRAFPRSALLAIEKAIAAVEGAHAGEIQFALEGALDGAPLFKGQSSRERALEVFAQRRVWDTEHNNGLLIYLLLADRAVEIVADRGIHAVVSSSEWSRVCRQMETAFKHADYEGGAVGGIEAVAKHLVKHFPAERKNRNELPDAPLVL